MKEYSDLNFLLAFKECCKKPGYKIGVIDNTAEKSKVRYESALKILELENIYPFVKHFRQSMLNREITFRNGSTIRFIHCSDNARGLAFCELLTSPDLSTEQKMLFKYTEKIAYERWYELHYKYGDVID